MAMGHTVKLLPARSVRPSVGGNKNDVADARAIWTAVQQPGIRAVAVKSDPYLRTLLIHGARSVLTHSREPPVWIQTLLQRRPLNVAVVALANKMARKLWALLAHRRTYQPGCVRQPV